MKKEYCEIIMNGGWSSGFYQSAEGVMIYGYLNGFQRMLWRMLGVKIKKVTKE